MLLAARVREGLEVEGLRRMMSPTSSNELTMNGNETNLEGGEGREGQSSSVLPRDLLREADESVRVGPHVLREGARVAVALNVL